MNWLQKLVGDKTPALPSRSVATPDWMKKTLTLPPWASLYDDHSHKLALRVRVDGTAAYKDWLALLEAPLDAMTQYWIECAYQCIKLDVQMAIAGSEADPRTATKPFEIVMERAPEYALANFPEGPAKTVKVGGVMRELAGVELASTGREARQHYVRIRGRLPF